MGPNGSGKSTLAKILGGHPDYKVTCRHGDRWMAKTSWPGAGRARPQGPFLAFQYPMEIPGVSNANFLRAAVQARLPEGEVLDATDYYARLYEKMDLLEIDRKFTARSVNEGFSGGEKKRNEILQMAMLEPKYAILDETDSGPRYRRAEDRLQGRECPARRRARHPGHHPLPAAAGLHRAGCRARDGQGPHRAHRRQGTGARTRGARLRLDHQETNWRNRPRPDRSGLHHYGHRYHASISTAASAISATPSSTRSTRARA